MTLHAKFFAFVAPPLLSIAAVPPLLLSMGQSNQRSTHFIVVASLLCAALVLAVLIVVHLAVTLLVSRPLRKMALEMNRIASGQQTQSLTQSHRTDELGLAARAFNRTTDTLQWSARALQAMNTSLERRFSLRTGEIEKAQQKYRSIFDAATEGIFQTTLCGRIRSANPAAVQMLGYDTEQQLMEEVTDLATQLYANPDDRQKMIRLLDGGDRLEHWEAEFKRRDNTRIWVSSAIRIVRDQQGTPLYLEGFLHDITALKLREQIHLQSEAEARKLALAVSRTNNPILITDRHGHLEWANEAFTALTGYPIDELIGSKPGRLLQGAETDPQTVQQIRDCVQRGEAFHVEIVNYSRTGRKYWLKIDAQPIRDADGRVEKYIAIEEDITERKLADWLEHDRRRFLEMIARDEPLSETLQAICQAAERQWEGVRAIVLLDDGPRREIAAAPRLSVNFVLGLDSLLTAGDGNVLAGDAASFTQDITTDPRWKLLHEAAAREGIQSCNQTPVLAGNGKLLGALVLFYEKCMACDNHTAKAIQSLAGLCGLAIEHHQLIQRLEYNAVHDPLTGLANRAQLDAQLPRWVSAAARHERLLSLMMIDLDGFKTVNDTLGHHIGDLLLRKVAERLSSAIRESDVLVRTGGDEFTMVATEIESPASAAALSERLVEALGSPFVVEGRELFVTASIGTSVFPGDALEGAALQRCAESAMYAAKAAGRNCARRFDPSMGEAALERLEMENQLRRAVLQNEFMLEYQPQVNHRGKVVGVEALVRWQHPQLGRVSPAKFIPVAEQCGMIVSIGTWVLVEACRQTMAWQTAGCPLRVSVNVSALQFQQEQFLDILKATLIDTGLPASSLELEITESLLLASTRDAIEKVKAVREMGVGVAIDDFGTGYSSLAYLQKLPIDRLKIDQSFVRDLGDGVEISTGQNRGAVITSIASLAGSLGMSLTAEGVETIAQRDFLVQLGCDTMQGYLFSRPVHADRIEAMVRLNAAKAAA